MTEDYRRHLERVLREVEDDVGDDEDEESPLNSSRKKYKTKRKNSGTMKPPPGGSDGKNSTEESRDKGRVSSEEPKQNGKFTNGNCSKLANGSFMVSTSHESTDLASPPNGVGTDSDSGVSVTGKSYIENSWCVKPVHLSMDKGDYPLSLPQHQPQQNHSVDFHVPAISSSKAGSTQLGAQHAAKYAANTDRIPAERVYVSYPVSSIDELVRDYFPVTLGASYSFKSTASKTRSSPVTSPTDGATPEGNVLGAAVSPVPYPGLPRPASAAPSPLKPKRCKSPRRPRPGSATSTTSSASKGSSGRSSKSLEQLFLFNSDVPANGKDQTACAGKGRGAKCSVWAKFGLLHGHSSRSVELVWAKHEDNFVKNRIFQICTKIVVFWYLIQQNSERFGICLFANCSLMERTQQHGKRAEHKGAHKNQRFMP